jgi:hypothetical protein
MVIFRPKWLKLAKISQKSNVIRPAILDSNEIGKLNAENRTPNDFK